ncbi:DUF4349 domain-containing protein [Clostridium lacusfryxellense]|uniref:DUF4349 domain-containing protein n=1 Tax=Clostridium lacusfryxellense TaxID=205328 RepID=UPI001C0BE253|nr:DUF4349 domain-containing protein [Clostridium lacusfryxellense]MBU3111600.1 DUF4349 domain-containing protein [Clostridium lacusfryxellense]
MKSKYKGLLAILILITMVSILIVGCSSSKSSSSSEDKVSVSIPDNNSGLSENSVAGTNGDTQKNDAKAVNESKDALVNSLEGQGKIIRKGIIDMETISFDNTVKQILSKTASMGAYVQSSNISGNSIAAKVNPGEESRRGEFILRIPKTKFDSFISDIGSLGSITNQKISSEDVTTAYFDTQAHLKSLNIQEERLLTLLKKTGELKDIIVLEKELSDVRYEIESLTGSLKKWDNLIDYCTLNIQISEVHKIKETSVSYGHKISNGFTSSLKTLADFGKGFIVIVFVVLPYAVVLSILFIIGRYVYIHIKKKR